VDLADGAAMKKIFIKADVAQVPKHLRKKHNLALKFLASKGITEIKPLHIGQEPDAKVTPIRKVAK
jgi:hypothetical protein